MEEEKPRKQLPSLVALCVGFLNAQLEYSPPPPSPIPLISVYRGRSQAHDREKEKEPENDEESIAQTEGAEDVYFPPFASHFLKAADSLPEELADIFLRSLLYSSTLLSTPTLLPSQQQQPDDHEEAKEAALARKQKLDRNIATISHFLCSRRFELELPNCPWLPLSFFVSLVRDKCPFLRSLNLSGCAQLDDNTLALMFAPSLTSSTTNFYLAQIDLSNCSNCSGLS